LFDSFSNPPLLQMLQGEPPTRCVIALSLLNDRSLCWMLQEPEREVEWLRPSSDKPLPLRRRQLRVLT
jgi:hypothetical protein